MSSEEPDLVAINDNSDLVLDTTQQQQQPLDHQQQHSPTPTTRSSTSSNSGYYPRRSPKKQPCLRLYEYESIPYVHLPIIRTSPTTPTTPPQPTTNPLPIPTTTTKRGPISRKEKLASEESTRKRAEAILNDKRGNKEFLERLENCKQNGVY